MGRMNGNLKGNVILMAWTTIVLAMIAFHDLYVMKVNGFVSVSSPRRRIISMEKNLQFGFGIQIQNSNNNHHNHHRHHRHDTNNALWATKEVETEEKMPTTTLTQMEEDVLFGSSSDTTIPYPSPKRHISKTGNLLQATNAPMNPLDHSDKDPLINKLHTLRSSKLTTCPQLWQELSTICPDKRALYDEHLCDTKIDLTFQQTHNLISKAANAFQNLGISKGSNIAILGENSAHWLLADHGIQLAGGTSAVRGADAPPEELRYIYQHSDSAGIAVLQGPKLLQKLAKDAAQNDLKGLGLYNDKHGHVKTIVLMHREKKSDDDIQQILQNYNLVHTNTAPDDDHDDNDNDNTNPSIRIHILRDLIDQYEPIDKQNIPSIDSNNDLSTIVYTSGTTGQPKGVMLTHANLLHQISHRLAPTKQYDESEPLPGELMLALLPVWHITERTFELWMLSRGCHVVYTNIRYFKNDLAKHKPQWMVLVPRVLEKVAMGVQDKFSSGSAVAKTLVKLFTFTGKIKTNNSKLIQDLTTRPNKTNGVQKLIAKSSLAAVAPLNAVGNKLVWKKVQDGFGGRLKCIISGGSALSASLESFYETCGITVCVGYGLTECSPLIAHRRSDANLVTGGCVGQPTMDTELRVVDPDIKPNDILGERQSLPHGEVGVVIARGPQVMKGYYKNYDATTKAIDKYGFFDTGDLGRINPITGDLILTGRCKDTIVLSNGENIEPAPIEDAILGYSQMIEQVMLTGQDGRSLVAILVLNPKELVNEGYLSTTNGKNVQEANDIANDPKCTEEDSQKAGKILADASVEIRKDDALRNAIMKDIQMATKDFRQWEQVGNVYLTLEPFAMANGLLTQSYKVKRDAVLNKYKDEL